MQSADWIAETMTTKLIRALKAQPGEQIALIVNGSGATTLMEMFVVFRKAYEVATAAGLKVVASQCDELLTVQEASGFQLFIGVFDDETLALYNAPSNAPYWVQR